MARHLPGARVVGRTRLAEETGKLHLDFAEMKHELLKWSFLLWLGQVAVLGSLVSLFLRLR